jgi:hypothetical protein
MPVRNIGPDLDALGAQVDVPDGYGITEANLTVTMSPPEDSDTGGEWEEKLSLPVRPSGQTPVPNPVIKHVVLIVEEGQDLSSEQRDRVVRWLRANGVDPSNVTADRITLEYKMYGSKQGRQFIGFTQYYVEDGHRVHAVTTNSAVKFQRHVEQTVALEPDPSWEGWEKHEEQLAKEREECG